MAARRIRSSDSPSRRRARAGSRADSPIADVRRGCKRRPRRWWRTCEHRACGRPGLDAELRSQTCPRAAGGSRSVGPRSAGSSTSCSRGWPLAVRSRSRRSSVSTRTSSVTSLAGSAVPTSLLRAAMARGARAPPTAVRRSPCDRRPTRVASERVCAPRTARSTCRTSRSRCYAGDAAGTRRPQRADPGLARATCGTIRWRRRAGLRASPPSRARAREDVAIDLRLPARDQQHRGARVWLHRRRKACAVRCASGPRRSVAASGRRTNGRPSEIGLAYCCC